MAKFNSRVSKFLIDDSSGNMRDLSAFLTEISGLPGERELSDSTTIGDAGRERFPGLENGMIRIAGFWDETADSGPDHVLVVLLTHTAAVTCNYGPQGSTTGMPCYRMSAWVRRYEITSRVGEMVGFTAELEVEGQITRDTSAFMT